MPKIIEIVRARKAAIANNPAEAQRTGDLARAAIMAGIASSDWRTYMEHFEGLDPDQLKRLLAQDATLGVALQDAKRAYIIANGMCGAASPNTQNLDFKVNSIDDGLPGGCDPEP
jgi:hypothetical protein